MGEVDLFGTTLVIVGAAMAVFVWWAFIIRPALEDVVIAGCYQVIHKTGKCAKGQEWGR